MAIVVTALGTAQSKSTAYATLVIGSGIQVGDWLIVVTADEDGTGVVWYRPSGSGGGSEQTLNVM